MQPVSTVGQVFDAIQNVKAGASGFRTNFFPVRQKVELWIAQRELFVESTGGAALFFRKDRDFWRLYFSAGSDDSLRDAAIASPFLKTEPVVTDVIGEDPAIESVLSPLESAGLRRYARLMRMALVRGAGMPAIAPDAPRVECASVADSPTLLELLNRSFDPRAEQLPALREIEAAAGDRQILVARHDGAIAGLLFFETQGATSLLRYWLVEETFRAFRYGSALMRSYLSTQSAVRRFVLWVMADNGKAIEKYRHFGFAPDKLVDQVLINQKLSPMKTIPDLLKEIRPEFDFSASQDFIADGMLDSYDVVTLVAALDKNWGISIGGAEIIPENFRNLETIRSLLVKYGVQP